MAAIFDRAVFACEGYIGRALATAALGAAAARIGKSPATLAEEDIDAFIEALSQSLGPVTSHDVIERISSEVRSSR